MPRIVKAPDVRRSELIAAAQQLFYSKGYERTSVNDIVEKVGVAKGTFYHYFDSKTAVLEAIINETIAQVVAKLQEIIADETLTAIPKWQKALQNSNDWKFKHKDEVLEAGRLLQTEENILLRYKLRIETSKAVASEMTKILEQGVEEGVFDVQFIPETAEIMVANIAKFSDTLNELFFHPEKYDDSLALAIRKHSAVQMAVERLLGAPAGSMPILDKETLIAWFTE
jgi:AcrR family transcriptional regulator